MSARPIWERPRLHDEEDFGQPRPVTWLELFFDLFFVVVIAELTRGLIHDPTLEGLFSFTLLFIAVWWVWIGDTYYAERFDSVGLEQRVFTYLLMVPVIGMAVFAEEGLGEGYVGFLLSYVAARSVSTLLWLRAALHHPDFRPTGLRLTFWYGLAIIVALTSLTLHGQPRLFLFGLALVIDVVGPLLTRRRLALLPRFKTSKLPERFGLFVIIVLGETIVAVVEGLGQVEELTRPLFYDAALGVAMGLALWWIYFDFVARRPPRQEIGGQFAWSYLHLPLVMGIAVIGAGLAIVIGESGEVNDNVQRMLGGAVAVALLAIALIERFLARTDEYNPHPIQSPAVKGVTALGALALAFSGLELTAEQLLLALLGLLLLNILYAAHVWSRRSSPQETVEEAEKGLVIEGE